VKEYVLGSPYKKSIFFSGGTTEKKMFIFWNSRKRNMDPTQKKKGG
jgi:hypothetical protein